MDHLHGDLSGEQRKMAEDHLDACEACAQESMLWGRLAVIPDETPSQELTLRFRKMLNVAGREPTADVNWFKGICCGLMNNARSRFSIAAVACGVLLMGVGFVAGQYWKVGDTSTSVVAEMHSQSSAPLQNMSLSLLQRQSASDRLRGAMWNGNEDQFDDRVLVALLYTLRHDSSVDVRLAALDTLSRYLSQPQVRDGLTDALETDQSPLVQVSLIDLMVEGKQRSVVTRLRMLATDPNANITVRQRAVWAIGKLS